MCGKSMLICNSLQYGFDITLLVFIENNKTTSAELVCTTSAITCICQNIMNLDRSNEVHSWSVFDRK